MSTLSAKEGTRDRRSKRLVSTRPCHIPNQQSLCPVFNQRSSCHWPMWLFQCQIHHSKADFFIAGMLSTIKPNVGGEDIFSKAASVCPLTDKSVYRGAEMSPAGAPGCWPTLRSLRRESWTLAPRLSGFWSLEDRCGLHHRRDI